MELFESSATALAKKEINLKAMNEEKVINKLDTILDQNKTIARGLTMMHEKTSETTKPTTHKTQKIELMEMKSPKPKTKSPFSEEY